VSRPSSYMYAMYAIDRQSERRCREESCLPPLIGVHLDTLQALQALQKVQSSDGNVVLPLYLRPSVSTREVRAITR
jgi:hypothetical protein